MSAHNYHNTSRLIAPRRLIGRYLGFLLVIVLITLYLLQDVDKNTKEYRKYRENLRLGRTSLQNKHILLWTPFFESKTWYQGKEFLDKSYFEDIGCDVTTCVVTTHRDLLESVAQYDAVLFQGTLDWSAFWPPPGRRSPLQYYVMSNLESPLNIDRNLRNDRGFFNLTMTYRLDSDIAWPYAVFEDQITGEVVAPNHSPIWRTPDDDFHDQALLDAVKRKSKMGAWFVSHCNTISHRDDLVRAMQQHVQIDVYGKCGPLKCPRSLDCDLMLETDYKFYLSFENSLCEDYVTEKLFKNMKYLVVPVVYGGANYIKFAPPRSYINANDFADVKQLTDYLVYLDQHPEEYIKYFWWKRWYRIRHATPFCDLCKKLYELDYNLDERQVYEDLDSWWRNGFCEQKPGIQF